MSWKTRAFLLSTGLVLGGAAIVGVRFGMRPTDEAPVPVALSPSSEPSVPEDPELFEQYRQAYRATLIGNSPPGMMELLAGPRTAATQNPASLPPLVPAGETLPLTGLHAASLDHQTDLSLPAAVLAQLGKVETLLVRFDEVERCLWLMTPRDVDRVMTRREQAANPGTSAQQAQRRFFAQTEQVTVAADGRLVLPQALVRRAELANQVIVVGAGDHFEVWDTRRWDDHCGPPTVSSSPCVPRTLER